MTDIVTTRFTIEELEYIRQNAIFIESVDFGSLCKCGELRLVLGGSQTHLVFDHCVYSHGEVLFKLYNLTGPSDPSRTEAMLSMLECTHG